MSRKNRNNKAHTHHGGGKANVQSENAKPNVSVSPSVPCPPPAHTHCDITCKVEKNWWDKFKPAVEIGTLVVLVIYTAFTAFMYVATRDSANTAALSLKSNDESFRLEERAWVGIDGVQPAIKRDGSRFYLISVTNSGKTPAIIQSQIATIAMSPEFPILDSTPIQNTLKKDDIGRGIIFPNGPPTVFNMEAPTDEDIAKAKRDWGVNDIYIYAEGEIAYEDIFKKLHRTHFCFYKKGSQAFDEGFGATPNRNWLSDN